MNNYEEKMMRKVDKATDMKEAWDMALRYLKNIHLADVDYNDHPDYADAYVDSAEWGVGTPLSIEELDRINEDNPEIAQANAYESLL